MTSTVACCIWAARALSSDNAALRRRVLESTLLSSWRSGSRFQLLPGRRRACVCCTKLSSAISRASGCWTAPAKLATTSARMMAVWRRKSASNAPSMARSTSGAMEPAAPRARDTTSWARSPNFGMTLPASTASCSAASCENASSRPLGAPDDWASPWNVEPGRAQAANATRARAAARIAPILLRWSREAAGLAGAIASGAAAAQN
mmetsp:Transcript_34654/g.78367  ORF Transcript_34654/g.78367 Transcript_34654/m.78367 type:complete len:206 (+) Transcript_34654:397-1014(+)